MKKITAIGTEKILVFLTIISLGFLLFPFFRHGIPVTDDGEWMIIRLSAFYQTLAEGQFPTRFLGRLNQNFGYPVANFLYPGFLYVGSVLHKIGLSFVDSVKAIIIGSVVVASVSLFLWLKKFFSTKESALGTLTFILSPYLLYDLYTRGSVGELVATGVFFLTLFLTEGGMNMLLPPIIAFLILSHNTYALLYGGLYVLYCIVRKKWRAFVPFALGIAMSSFFWLPALFERTFVVFNTVSVSNPFHYFPVSNMLLLWGLPFLCMVFYIAVKKDKHGFYRERFFFVIVFLIASFFISSLSGLFWRISFLQKLVQFPYRFFAFWFVTVPWLSAWFLSREKKKNLALLYIAVSLVISAIPMVTRLPFISNNVYPEGYYATNEATTTVHDEYMPRWVMQKPKNREGERLAFFSGTGRIYPETMSTQTVKARVVADEDSIVEVHTVFYPGWGATLDGKPVEIAYKNEQGIMRVFIPKGEHELLVQFRETVFRFMADALSVIGIVFYGIYVAYSFFGTARARKRNKRKRT